VNKINVILMTFLVT